MIERGINKTVSHQDLSNFFRVRVEQYSALAINEKNISTIFAYVQVHQRLDSILLLESEASAHHTEILLVAVENGV
ncbi:hypothetical protein D9M71_349010 [compost metagenome]